MATALQLVLISALMTVLRVSGIAGESCRCSSSLCNCNNRSLTVVPQDLPTYITTFMLDDNLVTTLGKSNFSRYRELTSLFMQNNHIANIHDHAFHHLPSLGKLYLAGNRLTRLRSDMFTGLGSLFYLSLHHNEISDIEAGTFIPTPQLSDLDMYGNKLTSLGAGMFAGLGNLRSLFLHENGISDIQAGTFNPTPRLARLYLQQNRLTILPGEVFANLSRLIDLRLHGNSIDTFPTDVLSTIPSLYFLELQGNKMLTLPLTAFNMLSSMSHVNISDNPWSCDCRMVPFRLKMEGTRSFEYQITCSQPDSLNGSKLRDISPEDLMSDCEEPTILRFESGDNNTVVEGETLLLVCEASGIPTPDITVILPSGLNVTVESGGRVTVDVDGTITITDVTAADAGLYVCIAASPVGSTSATLSVDVKQKEPPTVTMAPASSPPQIVSFDRSKDNTLVHGEPLHLVCKASGIITVIFPSGLNATVESGGRVTVTVNGTAGLEIRGASALLCTQN
ncbi:chondroadherin-like [Branchiostoma floridae]|uniref:Chondroadherin-like n=2 Tax=Branchiostoma floridae TaxID=7739 RepID=A0A9J7MH78_BRAFL|nr:chondroadherin-like [Branchiostoma floridae]